jgi:hypothetical protein
MSVKWDIIVLGNILENVFGNVFENVHNYSIPMGEVEKLMTIVEPMGNF